MRIRTLLSGFSLPILRFILTPFPGFRILLIKLCVLLEEGREPEESLQWLFEVHSFTEEWIDRQAIAWGNGIHMKHAVMEGIHSFFYERIPQGATVLDIGCGIGALASDIAQTIKGVKVIGIDFDPNHIRFASGRFKSPNLRFLVGDATKDIADDKVDVVVMSSVLEHISERVCLLRRLQAAYQPIRFLIRVPTSERHFHAAMKRHLGIFSYVDKDHKTEYTSKQFRKEMDDAGLEVVSADFRWGDIWAECRSKQIEKTI